MIKAVILAGGRSSHMQRETLKQYRKGNNDKQETLYFFGKQDELKIAHTGCLFLK